MNKYSPLLDAVLDRAPDIDNNNMTRLQAVGTFISVLVSELPNQKLVTGVAGMRVSPSLLFPRTSIPSALSSTSHSEICFPGYFVSPPALLRFSYNVDS